MRAFVSCGDYAWDAYRLFVLNWGGGNKEEDRFEVRGER